MAVVIEQPILELLGVTHETAFDLITDGKVLILSPIKDKTLNERFNQALTEIIERYGESFEELAKI